MEKKLGFSSYFRNDDDCVFIPFTAATDLRDTRYLSVIVLEPIAAPLAGQTVTQAREILARRHRFSPRDERAVRLFSREQFRPIIDGITLGIRLLLMLVGALTLGIGGVGVMNIMLVLGDRAYPRDRRPNGHRRHPPPDPAAISAGGSAIVAIGGAIGLVRSYS
jgi:putative ABC transport system permease protein